MVLFALFTILRIDYIAGVLLFAGAGCFVCCCLVLFVLICLTWCLCWFGGCTLSFLRFVAVLLIWFALRFGFLGLVVFDWFGWFVLYCCVFRFYMFLDFWFRFCCVACVCYIVVGLSVFFGLFVVGYIGCLACFFGLLFVGCVCDLGLLF